MSVLARKNLVVDPAKVRELADRYGTSESEAVRRAVEAALAEDVVRRLSPLYRISDEAAVRAYLQHYPFLVPLLEEARQAIATSFGDDARVDLNVIVDPEDGSEALFALVHSPLPYAEAGAALERLDQTWFIEAPTCGRFHVDLEFDDDAV